MPNYAKMPTWADIEKSKAYSQFNDADKSRAAEWYKGEKVKRAKNRLSAMRQIAEMAEAGMPGASDLFTDVTGEEGVNVLTQDGRMRVTRTKKRPNRVVKSGPNYFTSEPDPRGPETEVLRDMPMNVLRERPSWEMVNQGGRDMQRNTQTGRMLSLPRESREKPGELKPGYVEGGYVFIGGDPSDPSSWMKAR